MLTGGGIIQFIENKGNNFFVTNSKILCIHGCFYNTYYIKLKWLNDSILNKKFDMLPKVSKKKLIAKKYFSNNIFHKKSVLI